jgi:ribosomal protein S18 acetylase RimI-like enzyme
MGIITVRPADPSDAAAISGLMGELGYSIDEDSTRIKITQLSTSTHDCVLVAEADGTEADEAGAKRVVGVISVHAMSLLHVSANLGRITALIIKPTYQRHGIGSRLVEAAEVFARTQECERMEVTSSDHRHGAHGFYQELDYSVDERRFIKRL